MAGRHSPLMQRITHLLEHTPMTDVRPNRTLRWLLAGTALVAAAAVLPRIHVEAGALLPSLDELFGEGRVTRIATREPGIVQEIRIRGTATLAADSDRLGTVGGEIRIEETRDGHTRTLRITPAANGTLAHEWKLDGQVRPFDADAQAWLDARMPILVRHLSTPADRVVRLLRRGGQEAVLQAIERSGDAFDRARLTEALAARGPLDDAALARLIDAAPERADFERREALAALARSQPMDSARQVAWLRAAGGIASDFDRRSALEALAPKLRPEPAVLDAWRGTLGTMGSDFDRRSAIEALLARDQPSPAVLDAALQALRPIGSDFDRRTVLERIAPRLTGPAAALVPQYTQAAAALGGGFEQRSALVALIDAVPLDATGCLAVMDALDHVTSSFDLLTTLQALAPKLPADAVLVSRYRRLARHLDTFERGQAEQAIDKLERG